MGMTFQMHFSGLVLTLAEMPRGNTIHLKDQVESAWRGEGSH
jgi:hypothetical protein